MLHFVTSALDLMLISPTRILYPTGTEGMSAFIHYFPSTWSKIGSQCTCAENQSMNERSNRVTMKEREEVASPGLFERGENVHSIPA